MAVEGHAPEHRKQPVHAFLPIPMPEPVPFSAPAGHASIQLMHPMHREPTQCTSGLAEMLSGLWHHTHLKEQPLKKTVDLIPGPSSVDIRWILRMRPRFSGRLCSFGITGHLF